MFDCNSFLRRKGWGQKDLAERLQIGTSTVGMWCLGKSTPSYAVIEKLFNLGVTPKELFGEKIDALIRNLYRVEILPQRLSDPDFVAGFEKAFADMRAKGMLKDEIVKTVLEMRQTGQL